MISHCTGQVSDLRKSENVGTKRSNLLSLQHRQYLFHLSSHKGVSHMGRILPYERTRFVNSDGSI